MTRRFRFTGILFSRRNSALSVQLPVHELLGDCKRYGISAAVTICGTLCNLILTTLYAYPLSRKDLPGRNFFAFFLFFTMLFSGGLVPSYIMWTQTFHIRNSIFALLVPNLLMARSTSL